MNYESYTCPAKKIFNLPGIINSCSVKLYVRKAHKSMIGCSGKLVFYKTPFFDDSGNQNNLSTNEKYNV